MMAMGGFGMLVGLLGWAVIVALIVWGTSALFAQHDSSVTALEILRRRYARGEITEAELEQARRSLG